MTDMESLLVALRAMGWKDAGNNLIKESETQESMLICPGDSRIKVERFVPVLSLRLTFFEDVENSETSLLRLVNMWDFFKSDSRKRSLVAVLIKKGWGLSCSANEGVVLYKKTNLLMTTISFDENDLLKGKAVECGRTIHSFKEDYPHQGDSEPDRLAAMHQRRCI